MQKKKLFTTFKNHASKIVEKKFKKKKMNFWAFVYIKNPEETGGELTSYLGSMWLLFLVDTDPDGLCVDDPEPPWFEFGGFLLRNSPRALLLVLLELLPGPLKIIKKF